MLQKLGHWDGERGTPANAMHLQNAAAALLVLMGAWIGVAVLAIGGVLLLVLRLVPAPVTAKQPRGSQRIS